MSRAGTALLRELTVGTELAEGWTEAMLGTYKALPAVRAPGRVLADLAVNVADSADGLTHLGGLRDQAKLQAVVPSAPTAWRAVEEVDELHRPHRVCPAGDPGDDHRFTAFLTDTVGGSWWNWKSATARTSG